MKKKYKLALIKFEECEMCIDFAMIAKKFNVSVALFKKHLNLLASAGYLEYTEMETEHKEVYNSLISNDFTEITNIIKTFKGDR